MSKENLKEIVDALLFWLIAAPLGFAFFWLWNRVPIDTPDEKMPYTFWAGLSAVFLWWIGKQVFQAAWRGLRTLRDALRRLGHQAAAGALRLRSAGHGLARRAARKVLAS